MALSGSFKTNDYNGRYLVLSWTATQDSYWNMSTITWTLKSAGTSQYNYYNAGNFKVVIDGETVYSSSTRISIGSNTTIATGTKHISHNADGTRSFSASIEAGIYYVAVNCKGSGSFTLDKIIRAAQLLTTHEFTDEENLTITYKNPGGNSVTKLQAQIVNDYKVLVSRDISKTGTSYTFNFTEAERATMRAEVKNGYHQTFTIALVTTIGSNTYESAENRGFTIVNGEPTIAPSVVDGGSISTQLTGNPNVMIKHYNSMNCMFNATAKKGATITSYEVTCGGVTKTTSYANFSYVKDNVFTFSAIDSRHNEVTQTVTVPMVEYIPLTCNVESRIALNEENDVLADITFTISGNYFDGSFGAEDNELSLMYEIFVEGAEEAVSGGALGMDSIQRENGKYTVTCLEQGFDYTESYIVVVTADDKINTQYAETKSFKAAPVFDWSEHDFNFNVPVSFEGKQLADMVIEKGEEPMGSNGTWYWSKWKSGKVECYGCRNFGNMAVTAAWGSLYRSEPFNQELPAIFNTPPEVVDISFRGANNYGAWIAKFDNGNPAPGETGEFIVVRPASATLQQAYIGFHIIGR